MRRIRVQRLSVSRFRTFTSFLLKHLRDDDFIASRLATRGWDAEATATLQETYDDFVVHVRRFETLRQKRENVSEQFRTERDAFHRERFRTHVQLVDWALENDTAARSRLKLDEGLASPRTPFAEWISLASDFYRRLGEEDALQAALASVHLTPEEIRDGADTVERLRRLSQKRGHLFADRQQARRDRDAKRRLVEQALMRLQSLAVPVFRTTSPEHLELFGFTVPS